jgi:hypothetical protein
MLTRYLKNLSPYCFFGTIADIDTLFRDSVFLAEFQHCPRASLMRITCDARRQCNEIFFRPLRVSHTSLHRFFFFFFRLSRSRYVLACCCGRCACCRNHIWVFFFFFLVYRCCSCSPQHLILRICFVFCLFCVCVCVCVCVFR